MKRIFFFIAIALIIFACNSTNKKESNEQTSTADTITTNIQVVGMTCEHCEMTVQNSVSNLEGVISVLANHEDSSAVVVFDASRVTPAKIKSSIEQKGYTVN